MKEIERMNAAAAGLLFISESDHPLEPVLLDDTGSDIPSKLKQLSNKAPGAPVEEQTLDYFFRNHVKAGDAGNETAQKFIHLVNVLKEELTGVKVYRIGTVQVDAYILGKLSDGRYGGLHTILIET